MAWSKYWIYLKPVRHVLSGIMIDRTSVADTPSTTAFVDFTFNLPASVWSWPVGPTGRHWSWADPATPALFTEYLEQFVLPRLRSVDTLQAFETFASQPMEFMTSPLYGHRDCQLRIDIAMGRLDKALAGCRELDRLRGPGPHVDYFAKLWGRVTEPARPLLEANDIEGLVNLVRDWQARYVAARQLETIFEPAPFPLEALLTG